MKLYRFIFPLVAFAATLPDKADAQDSGGGIPKMIHPLVPELPGLPDRTLLWAGESGTAYKVLISEDLIHWRPRIVTAHGPVGRHDFVTSEAPKRFFKVEPRSLPAPAIVERYPDSGSFAVKRFSDVIITFANPTEINPASISLTVGGQGPFTLASSPNLTFSNGQLAFDTIDSPLGGFDENVSASLHLSTTAGSSHTYQWTFQLQGEVTLNDGIYVFGSPDAQRSGQRLSNAQKAVARATVGNIRLPADSGNDWELSQVDAGNVVIDYTGANAPVFTVGQLLTNAAPQTSAEIFYRRVTSLSDDPVSKRLLLFTTDVALTDFVQNGSLAASPDSIPFHTGEDGMLQPAFSGAFSVGTEWDVILSGEVFSNSGITLAFDELGFRLAPRLGLAFTVSGGELQRLQVDARADYVAAVVPRLSYSASSSASFDSEVFNRGRSILLGFIGFVPVWVDLDLKITLSGQAQASATASVSGGFRREGRVSFSAGIRNGSPRFNVSRTDSDIKQKETEFVIDGDASASLSLHPELALRLFGLAGAVFEVTPKLEVKGSGQFENGSLKAASSAFTASVDFNAKLSVEFDDVDLSWPLVSDYNLLYKRWCAGYPVGENPEIIFHPEPEDLAANEAVLDDRELAIWVGETPENSGSDPEYPRKFNLESFLPSDIDPFTYLIQDVRLQTSACVKNQNPRYQWYFNVMPIPGATGDTFFIHDPQVGDLGEYRVEVKADDDSSKEDSETIILYNQTPPAGGGNGGS